MTVPK